MVKVTFHGGAGTVTGSNFLIESGDIKVLIDCGLTQGVPSARERNYASFAYNPSEISHLIVTHAHVDHIGLIPRLAKEGFKGKILSTKATKALAEPLLLDSMELLAHEAKKSGREQLYEEKDVKHAMSLWYSISYHEKVELPDGLSFTLFDAGHILGSAMVRFERGGKSLVFTGDLGGGNSPLIGKIEDLPSTDYLVMESVYGDRVRPDDGNRRERLEDAIEETAARGGSVLIPAFSTERTQDLLYEIKTLMTEKRIPSMPVFVDSPLAQAITEAYVASPEYFAPDMCARVEAGEKLFSFPELRFTSGQEESRKIAEVGGSKIVLVGSGMMTGGRVFNHEEWVLPDEKSTLLIVGYQAAGTLGRRLLEGAKTAELFGKKVPVRCRVEAVYGYSAHMDGEELLEFVNKLERSVKQVFVVMGEPAAASFLAQRIRDYLGVRATVPEAGQSAEVDL